MAHLLTFYIIDFPNSLIGSATLESPNPNPPTMSAKKRDHNGAWSRSWGRGGEEEGQSRNVTRRSASVIRTHLDAEAPATPAQLPQLHQYSYHLCCSEYRRDQNVSPQLHCCPIMHEVIHPFYREMSEAKDIV